MHGKSRFLASFSFHEPPLQAHAYHQRCTKIQSTRLLGWPVVVVACWAWFWAFRVFFLHVRQTVWVHNFVVNSSAFAPFPRTSPVHQVPPTCCRARVGTTIYLSTSIKVEVVQKKSRFSASFSPNKSPSSVPFQYHLCNILCSTRLLRWCGSFILWLW